MPEMYHGQNEIHEMPQMRTEKLAEESADERRITAKKAPGHRSKNR